MSQGQAEAEDSGVTVQKPFALKFYVPAGNCRPRRWSCCRETMADVTWAS